MPKLLSGGVLRSGGSGQFITLPGAQPALGPTPTTGSGFTIITDATGITNYSNRLGFITFDSGVISGDLNQNISIRTTGTGSLQVDAPTTFNNSVSFGNTLTFVDITANGLIRFTGNFPSNSYTTGTLVVTGGVGISENLFVNQHLDVAGDIIGNGNITFDPNVGNISIQPVTGSLTIFPQSSGTLDNVKIGQSSPTLAVFTYTEITQRLLVSSFENSLSTTTGAVVINGGLGVGQDIHANRIFDNNLRVISQINVGKGLSGGGNGPTVSLTNTGVTSLTAGTGTNVNTSTGDVVIWTFGNTFQDVTVQGNTTNLPVYFNNTTNATSSTTGSVIIAGGLAVGKDIFVAGAIRTPLFATDLAIFSTTEITSLLANTSSLSQNALYVRGGVGIGTNLAVGGDTILYGDLIVYGTQTIVTSTVADIGRKVITLSTSGGPAILAVDSGITVGPVASPFVKWLFDGASSWKSSGNIIPDLDDTYTLGNIVKQWANVYTEKVSIVGATQATNTTSGALIVTGGAGIGGNLYVSGLGRFVSTTNALGLDQGALSVAGGASISRNLYVGGQLRFTSATNATSTVTGAVVITGGLGVGGDVYARNFFDASGAKFITTATLSANQVISIFAGTDTSVNTNSGYVIVWNTSTLQSVTNRGNETTNSIKIYNTTEASSTNTAALIVSGGVYVGKSLRVDNSLTVYGPTLLGGAYAGISEGFFHLHQGPDIGWQYDDNKDIGLIYHFNNVTSERAFLGRTNVNGYLDWFGTDVEINEGVVTTGSFGTFRTGNIILTTPFPATNQTTGALIVAGGVGISGDVYAGSVFSNGSQVLTEASFSSFGVSQIIAGTDTAVSTSTGAVTIWNTSTLQTITNRGNTTNNPVQISNTLTVDAIETISINAHQIVTTGSNVAILTATTINSTYGSFNLFTATNAEITNNLSAVGNIPYSIRILNNFNNTSSFLAHNISNGSDAAAGYTAKNDINSIVELAINGSARTASVYATGTAYLYLSDIVPTFSIGNNSKLDFYSRNIESGHPATVSIGTTGTVIVHNNLLLRNSPLDPTPAATLELTTNAVSGYTSITLSNTSFAGQSYTFEVGGNNKSGGSGSNVDEGNLTLKDNSSGTYRLIVAKNSGNIIIGNTVDDGINKLQVNGSFTATTATVESLVVNTSAKVGSCLIETSVTNINTTDPVSIDGFDSAIYRSAKCLVQVTEGNYFQVTEIVMLHDGLGNTYKSEYGIITTGNPLGQFSVDLNSGRFELYFTAFDSTPKSINVARTTLSI